VRCCLLNVGYSRAKPSKDGDAKPPVQKRISLGRTNALDSGAAGWGCARERVPPAVILVLPILGCGSAPLCERCVRGQTRATN
jgi:hypothetical protein